jgi:hypothetical protein
MRNPDVHDDLDGLLRSAATVQRDPATEERTFADVWSRVQASMNDDTPASDDVVQEKRLNLIADREMTARRRRRAARLASAALAVAVAGSGTAAAAFLSTRTGEELTGWEVGAGGSGEVLNLGGTDRRQVMEEVTADIPFPSGYEAQRNWSLNFYPAETDSAITESHLRSSIAGDAVCTWVDAWVAADNAGDVAARAEAAGTLMAAVSWEPFLTYAEDHGEPTPADSAERASYRWWLRPLADAAEAGNRQAVLDVVADSAACSYHVLPVIDAAPDYRYHGQR